METKDIYKALKRPFHEKRISWRVGATTQDKSKGIALAYIDARDVMTRFDEVFGLNWQCKYSHAEAKTICEIGVNIEGEWIWRSGGAGDTDIEAEKGAISDAFKRAAVLFGVGRYLYELPNVWVALNDKKIVKPPELPIWATPQGFDSGYTQFGNIHGEARTRLFDGMFEELTGIFRNTDEAKLATYKKWCEYLPEFKLIEEQNYVWFQLDSKIRSAIKFLQTQANYDERKAA
jgi:Rad52/22 family double-strand break repair protein